MGYITLVSGCVRRTEGQLEKRDSTLKGDGNAVGKRRSPDKINIRDEKQPFQANDSSNRVFMKNALHKERSITDVVEDPLMLIPEAQTTEALQLFHPELVGSVMQNSTDHSQS